MTTFRPYHPTDAIHCLHVFDSNTPRFFGPHERDGFVSFLQEPQRPRDYVVVERDGQIVACGGLAALDEESAGFVWGMVAQHLHRQGVGKALALARIEQAQAMGKRRVTLSTSQHVQAFYSGLGFAVINVVADGHGPGLDAVEMSLNLPPPSQPTPHR